MIIKNIELKNFRNYEDLNIALDDNVNIFLGDNAQGKTNILESIYMSSIGKSFRTYDDRDMIRFGSDMAGIKIIAEKDEEELTVEIVIAGREKAIKVNNVRLKRTGELLENIYTVIFSPEDLKIVKEDPEKRRRFIDRELCMLSSSYYSSLSDYKRILKQRNIFLKNFRKRREEGNLKELDIWDMQLSLTGAKIIKKRKEFTEKLSEISRDLHSDITGKNEDLDVIYEPNIPFSDDHNEGICVFEEALKRSRDTDIENGNTSRGPHRDDICIRSNGIDMRKFGSQGQQRTAALSLKLAEIELIREETGENAVLLLDDVMSELDVSRQSFLINALKGVQIFITAADMSEEVISSLPKGKRFRVENGNIKSEKQLF